MIIESLKVANLSQKGLSLMLGVHVNTVSAWATGKLVTPKYATAFLALLITAKKPCAKCAKIKEIVNENV